MPNAHAPDEPPIVAIVGPTATGKTAAAVRVAMALDGEIISADSMAVYRGMDIGTAKPTPDERLQVPFHLIDVAEPDEPFNVAVYKALAERALTDIRRRGKRPLLVGGTGLYVRAFLEDYGLTTTAADPALRQELEQDARNCGTGALHSRLTALDAEAAARIHPNDRIRIVRALEVTLATGRPLSEQHARDTAARTPRWAVKLGFNVSREELGRRIDARADSMIAAGFEEEVRGLLDQGYDPNLGPLRSLGYKEMVAYLRGEHGRGDAIDAIKQSTRRFAKRQLTWFRAERGLQWIDVGGMCTGRAADAVLGRLAALVCFFSLAPIFWRFAST